MPTDTTLLATAGTVLGYLLVLLLPGGLIGIATGLRGWALAGLAPLLSYAVGGLAGPWFAAADIPFNAGSFAIATLVVAAVGFGVRGISGARRAPDQPRVWERSGQLAVLLCLAVATAVGAFAVIRGLGGIERLDAVSQGFDAVYHANGIRYIADTGDGGLFGTGTTNWYGDANPVFYPNAYHLLAAVAYQLGNVPIPSILNANSVLLPGLLSLSLATLIREFRGRVVFAGAAALLAAAPTSAIYESLGRGPLLPFLVGLALTPVAVVALNRYLRRPAVDTGFVLLLAAAGLLSIHSSTLFGGVLFALPMLVSRWISPDRRTGRDLLALLAIAIAGAVACWPHLSGALGLASSDIPYWGWPREGTPDFAVGGLLAFQHDSDRAQLWLGLALVLGLWFARRLGSMRWLFGTALLTSALYVAVSSSDSEFVMALARPWWDDPVRFLAMAVVPLTVLAAHGLAESQAVIRDRLADRTGGSRWVAAGLAASILAAFALVTNGLYARTNGDRMAPAYQPQLAVGENGIPVSPTEADVMVTLGTMARPGEWALNDRFDGTVWTYALSGVRTVAGHYDQALPPSDALLLADHFREYATNPAVRDAVRRLNVRWVVVGHGGYPPEAGRQPGLMGLDSLPFVQLAYRNHDAAIYRIVG